VLHAGLPAAQSALLVFLQGIDANRPAQGPSIAVGANKKARTVADAGLLRERSRRSD
jgi:hypothetical protein